MRTLHQDEATREMRGSHLSFPPVCTTGPDSRIHLTNNRITTGGTMRRLIAAVAALCLLISAVSARAADALPTSEQIFIPKVNQQAMDKLGFRFGVQIYTFRAMTAFEALDVMKTLGIHYVELFGGQKMSKDKSVNVGPEM